MTALGIPLSGRIPADHMASEGRAIARFTDMGYGTRVREILASGQPDGEVPDDLLRAAVQVLAAWDWGERPAAIISIGSRTYPRLITSVAAGLATIGRLPYLGGVRHTGASHSGRSNSAQRLRAVYGTYHVEADMAAALPGLAGKPILLVDDRTDTGWTLTVVAGLLRQAGAGPIYPFVLAVEA